MKGVRLSITGVLALLAAAHLATARKSDPYPPIAISGQVVHAEIFRLLDLQKLPQSTIPASFVTGHGTQAGTYSGPLLIAVLDDAGIADAPGKNATLRHTIVVTGSDGYAADLAIGEIDPDYEGKQVILATSENGHALDPSDGVRLVVPGDRHGGRSVKQVVGIDIR